MALMNCPECGNTISDTAKKCPHCGYNIFVQKNVENVKQKKDDFTNKIKSEKTKKVIKIIGIIILVIVVLTFINNAKYEKFSGEYRGDCLGFGLITFESDKTGSFGAFSGPIFDYKISGDTVEIYDIYDTVGTTGYNPYSGYVIEGKIDGNRIYFGDDGEYYQKKGTTWSE